MINDTEYFNDYEERFYNEKIVNDENLQMVIGYINLEKELNREAIMGLTENSERIKLNEYNNIKKIISTLLRENYPYISYVYGGFKSVHELSLKYNIP